jgi:orotidine-5'-phosphate decarboxylase
VRTRQPTAWSAWASIRTSPRLPDDLRSDDEPLFAFNRRIVDATCDLCAAYKPQIAFYSALGKEAELAASIRYIRERAPAALIILDAKRGDIGNTAEAYAREAFERYDADAVTVNPYMGEDAVLPFLARPERGAVLLCRTSNPGGHDFQDLVIDGAAVVQESRAARGDPLEPARQSDAGGRCHASAGDGRVAARAPRAFFPRARNRRAGRRPRGILSAGLDAGGKGLLVSSSRALIYAGGGTSAAIREAAQELHGAINRSA